jgi:hypothetical protein
MNRILIDKTDGGVGGRERGSALILAILIMVIMTLLGFSYLLLADTENQISVNEKNYAQALYVAEAGVRIVKIWFDKPADPAYQFPDVTDTTNVIRTLRMLDHDNDPGTGRVLAAEGDMTKPIYRDIADDLFEKPYRGGLPFMFSGTEDGPDLRIVGTALDGLNDQFFPDFPSPTLRARITRIEVYEPPIYQVGPNWIRYGMATIKVTAGVFANYGSAAETQVAERVVKAILNETPYPGPGGPLQSCTGLNTNGDLRVHWGDATSVDGASVNIASIDTKQDSAFPWQSRSLRIDDSTGDLTQWVTDVGATNLEDPWYRLIVGGAIAGAPAAAQPYPWPGTIADPNIEHSNIFHNQGTSNVNCPEMDYTFWKQAALTGGKNTHYFTWNSGLSEFCLFGSSTNCGTFREWTDEQTTGLGPGFYFFDSADASVPTDTDSDGFADNLSPAIALSGGTYTVQGFVYLNAVTFSSQGMSGTNLPITPPGEPYVDANLNDEYDDGEIHLNIVYPATHGTGYGLAPGSETSTSILDYDRDAPLDQTTQVNFNGVFYTSGSFDATGNAIYYGSVVAKEGMTGGSAGTPDVFFDERLVKGEWPPPEYELPRVIITSWETDL